MHRFILKSVVSLAGISFSFFFAHTALAVEYTVTVTDDEIDVSEDCLTANVGTTNTDCSLREAIDNANGNTSEDHTITVPAGTFELTLSTVSMAISTDNDDNQDGDLDITNTIRKITIVGDTPDTTIIDGDGGNMMERVFEVIDNANLELQDLRVADGNAAATGSLDGGGIYVAGTLTLDGVTVSANNNDGGDGAGIYIDNSTGAEATIIDSTITGNQSDQHGGGIYNEGDLTITDSVITSNTASSSSTFVRGGGIYNGDTADITGSEISSNTVNSTASNSFGGGIHNHSSADTTVTNSTIGNNTASSTSDAFGGGSYIFNDTATVTFNNVTVAQNTAEFGGGIYAAGSTTAHVLYSSLIADNTATGDDDDCYGTHSSTDGYNFIKTDSSGCTGLDTDSTNTVNSDPGIDASLTSVSGPDYFAFTTTTRLATEGAINYVPAANCITVLGASPTDQLGNSRTGYCDVGAFEHQDTTDPVLALLGDSSVTTECGETYSDAGATATDDVDGEVTADPDGGSLDSDTPGEYTYTYDAEDRSLNTDSVSRTVTVSDTINPTLTLVGESTVDLTVGDAYSEQGATASDSCDVGISDVVGGDTVDTETAGTYVVTYNATDASGNVAPQLTRTVTVSTSEGEGGGEDDDSEDDPVVTVTTNGKVVRVFEDGVKVAQKKVNNKKIKKKYRKLKVKNIYKNKSYQNVVVLTANKRKGKVTVFRLTKNNELKKKASKTFAITNRSKLQLNVKSNKKRVIAKVGKASKRTTANYKLTKKGKLKKKN